MIINIIIPHPLIHMNLPIVGQCWHKDPLRANFKYTTRKRGVVMNDKKNMTEITIIECAVCLKEVPESEARIAEAQDYIQHFCGIDCYKQWQDKHGKNQD